MYTSFAGFQSKKTVEHRFSLRKPVAVPVEIFHHKRYLGSFQTRNISHRGAFVDTGQIDLFCNDFVQMNFTMCDLHATGAFNLKALVLHQSKQGIGIMFADHSPVFFRVLQRMLDTGS